MVQAIVNSLNKLTKLHESLTKVAAEKTEYIKTEELDKLDERLKAEQSHLAAIRQTDREREEAVRAYAQKHGLSHSPTVRELIEQTDSAIEKKLLTVSRDRLLHAIEALQRQNDLNQQLTYQSLQLVNYSLSMFRPPSGETMNYSQEEVRGVKGKQKLGTFDSQI